MSHIFLFLKEVKEMFEMKYGFIIMLLLLVSNVQAATVTDLIILENIANSTIGGNINRLSVEYSSIGQDADFLFKIESPFLFENNTPELQYIRMDLDSIQLNCTKTMPIQTEFILSCNDYLEEGRHNSTIEFVFAPNIMPGIYNYTFKILDYEIYIQQPSYNSHTWSPATVNQTIIVTREWLTPVPLVVSNDTQNDTSDNNTTDETKIIKNETIKTDDMPPVTNKTITDLLFASIFLAMIIIVWALWLPKAKKDIKIDS